METCPIRTRFGRAASEPGNRLWSREAGSGAANTPDKLQSSSMEDSALESQMLPGEEVVMETTSK